MIKFIGVRDMNIDEAFDVFLLPTEGLSLRRILHGRLLDSLLKSSEANDKRTRARHGARVEAFLAGCRSYADREQMVLRFGEAFPRECGTRQFIEAARLLRLHLVDRASRLHLPAVTNRGQVAGAPVPTYEQVLRTVKSAMPIKASAEKRIGHPLLVQTIRQHGWTRSEVLQALSRRYPDVAEAERYVRTFAKNGAFESST